ncbi:hypothetical protein B0H16DRAFT_1697276 [Mycena metata]|uniref:Uncharacterized protein n=1 Tax=Mycena metata TaxID=1033252 RepID=A0AAD7HVJ2_9AGAR|nr:hypothetical protein B0H16DRAFT_1697276 [Mycena metata]
MIGGVGVGEVEREGDIRTAYFKLFQTVPYKATLSRGAAAAGDAGREGAGTATSEMKDRPRREVRFDIVLMWRATASGWWKWVRTTEGCSRASRKETTCRVAGVVGGALKWRYSSDCPPHRGGGGVSFDSRGVWIKPRTPQETTRMQREERRDVEAEEAGRGRTTGAGRRPTKRAKEPNSVA